MSDERLYYVQDTRNCVGNCAVFWAPNGNGYVCDLDKAGVWTEAEVKARNWRDTDMPVLKSEVDAIAIRHARVDTGCELLNMHRKPTK